MRILTEEMSKTALESGEVWFDFFDYLKIGGKSRRKENEGLGFWEKEKMKVEKGEEKGPWK